MSKTLRALVVDDNDLVRRALVFALQDAFAVDQADGGEAALKLARDTCYDVVLLDVTMPHEDGYAVCRRLRALPHGLDMLIVFCTGRGGIHGRADGLAAGGDGYLVKPMTPSAIRQRLQEFWLQRYGALPVGWDVAYRPVFSMTPG